MIMKVIIALTCLAAMSLTVTCQDVCGIVGPIWRNYNQSCPPRAVCGDIFDHVRDWRNGTTCFERRILHHCMCPGNNVCPFGNPHHRLFASGSNQQFLCQPVCSLPWCNNVITGADSRPGDVSAQPIAMSTEQRAQEFRRKSYNKMHCRCPRHFVPTNSFRQRTVTSTGYRWNQLYHRFSSVFVCDQRWDLTSYADPCP